jgi:hypothetical protein
MKMALGNGASEMVGQLDGCVARICGAMHRSLGAFEEIGKELRLINQQELFLARYATFAEFVSVELQISWQRALCSSCRLWRLVVLAPGGAKKLF